jgi:hypothetical protein
VDPSALCEEGTALLAAGHAAATLYLPARTSQSFLT